MANGYGAYTDGRQTYTYNGVDYDVRIAGTGANWVLTKDEKEKLLLEMIKNGGPLTAEQLIGIGIFNNKNIDAAQRLIYERNKSNFDSIAQGTSGSQNELPRDTAFNQYYNDLYGLEEGSSGKEMLTNLEGMYENKAQTDMVLADAAFQQQALQQAQVVKNITDQVRGERMARLRAGMSESQIANQDMQMMMANVNALNDQVDVANQTRLQAQGNMVTAKDQAYADYLTQANSRGQVASAMYAADSGNPYQLTMQKLQQKYGNNWTSAQFQSEYDNTINSGTK